MPDNNQSFSQVPESKTVAKKRTRFSLVWVIPIVTAIQTPAAAATMGMTQTSENRVRFLATVLDSGT